MAEKKNSAKRQSAHSRRKAERKNRAYKSGYEYQMPIEQYKVLIDPHGGKMKSEAEIITYLNNTGNYMREIAVLTLV